MSVAQDNRSIGETTTKQRADECKGKGNNRVKSPDTTADSSTRGPNHNINININKCMQWPREEQQHETRRNSNLTWR